MSVFATMPSFSHTGSALIASPDAVLRQQVLQHITGQCRPVQQVVGGADALARLESETWRTLFLDRRLPDLDAQEVMRIIEKRFPGTEVVLLDSSESPSRDVPRKLTEQNAAWQNAPACRQIEKEGGIVGVSPLPGMIGASPAMQRIYRMTRLVARRMTTVLVTGPTGTGKELVARGLHDLSPRSGKPFVVVNCAAIPETLFESELFGYTRGAFTGAIQSQVGRVASAQGGTLFLDEISELPLGMQAKLLRFLEQKEVQRLGASGVTHVDVRVVAASNVDLSERASRNQFRQDLFYRLSVFPIELPSLAERLTDIVPLAEHFLKCMSAAMEVGVPKLSARAVSILEAHHWNGNVRELQHVMERASILVESGDTIDAEHLYFSFNPSHRRGAVAIES